LTKDAYQELKLQVKTAIIEHYSATEQTQDIADTIISLVCNAMGQEAITE
jgi:hypothetical protein